MYKFSKCGSNDEKNFEHNFNYTLDPKYDIHTTNTKSEQIKKKEINLNEIIANAHKASNALTTDSISKCENNSTTPNDY